MRLLRAEIMKMLRQRFAVPAIIIAALLMLLCALQNAGYIYEWTHPEVQIQDIPVYKENVFFNYSDAYSLEYASAIKQQYQHLRDEHEMLSSEDAAMPGIYGMAKGNDLMLFSPLYAQIIAAENALKERNELLTQAKEVLATSTHSIERQRAEIILSRYDSNLQMITFYQDGTARFIEDYLYSRTGMYQHEILFLLLSFLFSGSFCGEHSARLYDMIYSAKYGRGRLFCAKLGAVFLLSFLMTVLFFCIGGFVFSYKYCGIHGLNSAIQMLTLMWHENFAQSAFSISCGEYLMLLFFMIWLRGLILSIIAVLLSVIVSNSLYSMLPTAAIGTAGLTLMKSEQMQSMMQTNTLTAFIPGSLLFSHHIFSQFDTVTLFGNVYLRLYVLIIASLFWLLLLVICSALCYLKGGWSYGAYTRRTDKTIRQKDCSI